MNFLITALFFLSGFCALIYQVIWQRMLGLFTGVDIQSSTLIVSAYMLGMGVGSLSGGYIADRFRKRDLLGWFTLFELMIGLYALASVSIYYEHLYTWNITSPALTILVLFTTLLVPTFCMGATLPLLSKVLTPRIERASHSISSLYALNTIGAAGGALSCWKLIQLYGQETSLQIGSALNFLIAGATCIAWLRHRHEPSPAFEGGNSIRKSTYSFVTWASIYALSGFIALGFEILWFRVLGMALKSTSFTFPYILSLYLLGIGGGSFVGLQWIERVRKTDVCFFSLQLFAALYSFLAIVVFVAMLPSIDLLADIWLYLGGQEEFIPDLSQAGSAQRSLYFVVAPLLVVPPTMAMGASFPFLQKAIQTEIDALGKRVGWLQTANIIGATLGAAIVGLVLLSLCGSAGTLAVLAIAGVAFALLLGLTLHRPGAAIAASILLVIGIIVLTPSNSELWASLHGSPARDIISEEDGSGVVALRKAGSQHRMFINGIDQSTLPYASNHHGIHTELLAIPLAIHPDPKTIAVIGLGTGETVFAGAAYPGLTSIHLFEIMPIQFDLLQRFQQGRGYPGITILLEDQRIERVIGDARIHLKRESRLYDVIETDPLLAHRAYSGNLYSLEYFELLKSRLSPRGIAVTWRATPRTTLTFLKSFPYVYALGLSLLGSSEPIQFDPKTISARLAEMQPAYSKLGIDIRAIVRRRLARRTTLSGLETEELLEFNTDLFPKDEYFNPQEPAEVQLKCLIQSGSVCPQ